ncbi:spondin domain-containing protein [Mangrovimonas xylaniphaga]|uniref:spondin domain-containing protein n=1 Tax=Mangrovimonas xylaniphaga TaxID=1645915 RepID=UPI0006B426E9|nr:spondin domain-containing protein [Mangrovimonas xylaniphaga]
MRTVLFMIAFMALMFTACTNDTETIASEAGTSEEAARKANENNAFTTFKVTIANIGAETTYPTVLSPGVFVVQKKNTMPLFMAWEADYGEGVEGIAEDGNPSMLHESLSNAANPDLRSFGVFNTPVGADMPSPITPGNSYEFYVTAKHNDYLNFVTMYAQSNDIFIAPEAMGIALFDDNKMPISGDVSMYLSLWDAGTEVNEEPGIGPNQAPRQSAPNTGEDEHGVVRMVDDGFTYPEIADFIQVTVTPME